MWTADNISDAGECVQLTPEQSNEIILEKLTHLEPIFACLLNEMISLKEDLSNGSIRWSAILAQHGLAVGHPPPLPPAPKFT